MSTSSGRVDGSVVDRERGDKILSLLLAGVRPGSKIRVSSTIIRVDTSGCRGYNAGESERGEVSPVLGADSS